MEEVIVIGHKNPDTDTVISSVVLSGIMGWKPGRAGEINKETEFVLNRFGLSAPELIVNATGRKIFLVDHNEATQIVDGHEEAEIVGILDHHKVQFSSSRPLYIHIEPLGSTASLIAKLYMEKIRLNPAWAGALLGAIMSDTVIFKSPTTTDEDKKIAGELAEIAGIGDVAAFGLEVKKANASLSGKSVEEIVGADYKDFVMSGKKIGIGQTEVVDAAEVAARRDEIVAYIDVLKLSGGYEMVIFAATDIINEGSELFFSGDKSVIEKAFGVNIPDGERSVRIPGLMSRKKQIVPPLEEVIKAPRASIG